jgi:hypothetical protein
LFLWGSATEMMRKREFGRARCQRRHSSLG